MICQECGFSHKNQFIVCPECSSYQFRANYPLSSLILSFILASVVFGLTLFALSLTDSNSKVVIMLKGHWINSVILLVSYWGIFLVIGKFFEYTKQKKALSIFLDVNVMNILSKAGALSPEKFHTTIHDLRKELVNNGCGEVTEYVIFDLVRKTLYHLESSQQKEEINDILNYHAQLTRNRTEESFSMLKILYWAIPILGFIGTVLGIGVAIGAFSEFVGSGSDNAGLKDSLVDVTKGLSVAFDSTLIALSFTVIILPIGSTIENLFENLITQSEEYCLSFITPNMDFAIDVNSPAGILKQNVETLGMQSRYLQDFMVEFTSFVTKFSGGATFKERKTTTEEHSDGSITEASVDMSTGILPEGMENTDSYPTEALKAVGDTELLQYEDDSGSREKIQLISSKTDHIAAPALLDDDSEVIETEKSGEESDENIAKNGDDSDTDENEATLLESLINEKDDENKKK